MGSTHQDMFQLQLLRNKDFLNKIRSIYFSEIRSLEFGALGLGEQLPGNQDPGLLPLCSMLVHRLGSSPDENQNWPHMQRARKDKRKRQTIPGWQVAVLISKGTCVRGCFRRLQGEQTFTSILQNFRSLYKSLSRIQPHTQFRMVSTTHHIQGVSSNGSQSGDGGRTYIPRTRGGKKPLIAQVQLVGQLVVTSSQRPPQHPTISAASQSILSVSQPAGRKTGERTKFSSFRMSQFPLSSLPRSSTQELCLHCTAH